MCLIALIGAVLPRFALFLTWLFTDRISRAIDSNFVAFIGFLFLPYTTLFYTFAYAPIGGVSGFGWIIVILGLLLDLGNYGGSGQAARSRNRV
jgi:hypothetical protein